MTSIHNGIVGHNMSEKYKCKSKMIRGRTFFRLVACLFPSITAWVDRMDSGTFHGEFSTRFRGCALATGELRYKTIATLKF